MIIKSSKLRQLTITMQLIAGIILLTASFLSTEKANPSQQPTATNALAELRAGNNC